MKKIATHISFIPLVALCLVFVASCSKKETKQVKKNGYKVEGDYALPATFTLGGMNLKDTANNIYGALLTPMSKIENNPIDVKPIRMNIGRQMKFFVASVRKDKSKTKHFIEIRPLYFIHYDSLYSCLLQKRTCINGKDTLKEYNTVLYNFMEQKPFGFNDIFSVNEQNLSAFLALFPQMKGYDLAKLKSTDFNIEMDSIAFNITLPKAKNNCLQQRIKQSKAKLKPFICTTKIFKKTPQR
jgi:hypothetical protein